VSTFSHSRISAFESCPKKYEFCYLLKAPRGPEGVESFMGSRVHEALEWLYEQVRLCRLPDEEDVIERYVAAWDEKWDDAIRVTRSERCADDYRAIGEKAVRDYYRRYHPFDQGVSVGLEMRINVKLDDSHEIVGYIDRLTKVSDGVWEIHDYKTSNSLMTQQQADADRQLALYALGVREVYPDACDVTLIWHYLAFDHEVRSTRTLEQLEQLRAEVLGSVLHIEAQSTFPTHTSTLCDWCEYQTACPAWRHKFEAETLPEGERPAQDAVALVDEYLAVSDELARLKTRQDGLREAIAAFANDEGLDRVFGTSGSLKVFRFPQLSLPDAKDPRRAELEAVLREIGLWDRFACLSTYAFSRAMQDGAVSPEQAARLEPYITRSDGLKLYPGRR